MNGNYIFIAALWLLAFALGFTVCWVCFETRIGRPRESKKPKDGYLILVTGDCNNRGVIRPLGYFEQTGYLAAAEVAFNKAVVEMTQEKSDGAIYGVKVRLVRFESMEVIKTFAI